MNNIWSGIKSFFTSRNVRYGSNAVILTAVVIAIAVVVNALVGMTDLKLDLTPNKLYSIGDTTVEILKGLEKEVEIIGLFDESQNTSYADVTRLLEKYDAYPGVTVKYIDPDKNTGLLNELDPEGTRNIERDSFVVRSGNKMKVLDYYDIYRTEMNQYSFQVNVTGSNAEQSISGAIKYVVSEDTPVVYFATGHGEYEMDSDMSQIKSYLERNNYEAKTLNLFTSDRVPEDAEMLMVPSPKRDLSVDEAEKLQDYLDNGGKAIFMFDSLESASAYPQFEKIFENYNIGINYDRIKENDTSRHIPDNQYVVLLDVKGNSVIDQGFQMVLADSRSVKVLKNTKEYITTTSLMSTSDQAVGEQIDKSAGADNEGPLDVAIASENKGKAQVSKIIVMGNASYITDSAQQMYGQYFQYGASFFLQSLNWMLDRKDEVIIETKTFDTPLLTINAQQSVLTGIGVAVVLPLLILGGGLTVYLRRRHL